MTANTRTEVDLLGEMQVSNDVWYGIHTLRAMNSFEITGRTINEMPHVIKGMVMVKKACALANRSCKVLPQNITDAIVDACDDILDKDVCMDQFPSDIIQGGAGTSLNMNANEVVANLALDKLGLEKGRYDVINPADHVNMSQSTNDSYATGIRLGMYQYGLEVVASARKLQASFEAKAKEFDGVIKMGRTQLQDAVPMTLGQEFAGFASLIREEIPLLERDLAAVLTVNMGATAIGTGINTPPGYREAIVTELAAVTGWNIVGANDLIASTSDCTPMVSVHGALKRLAVKLSKIANDLRLLSSGPRAGLKEINLPEMQAGSSIMPAKVNPVIPEAVNQTCFKVFGNDLSVTFSAEASQLQLNVMEPLITHCIVESASWLTAAMKDLRVKCVDGITMNAEAMNQMVMNSIGLVTYLNPVIGHHEGDMVGAECARTGKTVREVVLERGLLSEEEINNIFTTENLINPAFKGELFD